MTCADVLREHWDITDAFNCCDSCHEDEAEGYFPLLDIKTPSGEEVLLCCGAWQMIPNG